jgi:hypothetical protein
VITGTAETVSTPANAPAIPIERIAEEVNILASFAARILTAGS